MIGEREPVTTKANTPISVVSTHKTGKGLGANAAAPRVSESDSQTSAAPSAKMRGFQFEAISIFAKEGAETAAPLELDVDSNTPVPTSEPAQKEATRTGKKKGEKAQEDIGQAARKSIHQLLKTGVFDWRVTPKEAEQVLKILLGLEPLVLFQTVQAMQFGNGDAWRKFQSQVPASDALAQLASKLSPMSGLLMPGDVIRLEVFSGAQANTELSRKYTVSREGMTAARLPAPIQLIGLSPYQAVNTIGQAYIDGMVLAEPYLELVVMERGSLYPRDAQKPLEKEWTFQAHALPNTPEGKKRAKLAEYRDYIKSVPTDDPYTMSALLRYYGWLETNETTKEFGTRTPEDVWRWALKETYAPPLVSKLEPYYRIADWMSAKAKKAPPEEAERLLDALMRYDAWLDVHANDPKLAEYDPTEIWVKAYRGAIEAELQAERKRIERESMKEALAPRLDWDKASKKLDEALRFLMTNVYQMPVPHSVKARETVLINEAKEGEPVDEALFEQDTSYLIEGSEQERLIRQKMGGDFLDSVIKHMTDPDFTTTTVASDFQLWLAANPGRLLELQVANATPQVSKRVGAPEIPTWQRVTDMVILMIPYLGQIAGGYEALVGEDLFGHNLGMAERGVAALFVLVPVASKLFKSGKGALSSAQLAKEYKLSTAQWQVLNKALTKIEAGTSGNKLLTSAIETLNKGGKLSKAELGKLETLAKEMGLADDAAAFEFSKGIHVSPAKELTKAEIAALKAKRELADEIAAVDAKLAANPKAAAPLPPPIVLEPYKQIAHVPPDIDAILKKGLSATPAEWQTVKKYVLETLQKPQELNAIGDDFGRLLPYLKDPPEALPSLTSRAKVTQAVENALAKNPGAFASNSVLPPEYIRALESQRDNPANKQVLQVLDDVMRTQQDPGAYAKTFGEIWERAKIIRETAPGRIAQTGRSPMTLAMVDMLAERGVKIQIVTQGLDDVTFKSTILDPGAALLDLAFAGDKHGIGSHMFQFLTLDDMLRSLPVPTTMQQFLMNLAQVTGQEGLSGKIWIFLMDTGEGAMTSPEGLRARLSYMFPMFE